MKFTKKILKNGLRVIMVPMKDNPTVTVLVLVEAGSKYETKQNNGLSHFLEHMCFKGTALRPRSIDISHELDRLGAQSNAFTSHEYTGYYAKADAKHFHKIFDVISDIYLNSTFPAAEMEKEKGVIIEEINMYEDLPQAKVGNAFMELLYGNQPAGWPILGSKQNIKKMKRDDFLKYRGANYLPQATTVVVAGHINEREVLAEITKAFGALSEKTKSAKQKVGEKQGRPGLRLVYKKTDQTHLILGLRTFGLFDRRNPVLAVLSGVLGAGMSSRLFQKLREELGVCYYVRASKESFTDHGFLEISAGVDNKRVLEVVGVILEECRRLVKERVPDAELLKVKEFLIGNSKLGLESSDELASFFGSQEILQKKVEPAEEKFKKIRAVTAEDVGRLARQIFADSKLNLALVGPFKKEKPFRKILKM